MKPESLKLKDLAGMTLKLEVKVTRELKFRLAVAKFLFKLGASVLGCQVEIS